MVNVYSSSPTLLTEQMQKRGILAAVAWVLAICPDMDSPTMSALTLSTLINLRMAGSALSGLGISSITSSYCSFVFLRSSLAS